MATLSTEARVVQKVCTAWELPAEAVSAEPRTVAGENHVFLVVTQGTRRGTYDLDKREYAILNLEKFLKGREGFALKLPESAPGTARMTPDQVSAEVLDHLDEILLATRQRLIKHMTVTRHGRLAKLAKVRNVNEVAGLLVSVILGEGRS